MRGKIERETEWSCHGSEDRNPFYPKSVHIASDAWHKFVTTVGADLGASNPWEERCAVLHFVYELACVINAEVVFISVDPRRSVCRFGPRTRLSEGGCFPDTLDWLAVVDEFWVTLEFHGDPASPDKKSGGEA